MNEKLTWDEIKRRYPDEWVALVDYEWPEMRHVTEGVVYAHSPSRDELHKLQRGLTDAAILFTGKKRGCALLAAVDVVAARAVC